MSLKEYMRFIIFGFMPILLFILLSVYVLYLLNWANLVAALITSIIILFPIFKYIDFLVDKDII